MPLLYSINGRASTYDRIQAISPVTPARPSFSDVLAEQISKEGTSTEHMPQRTLRGYQEEPREVQRKRVLLARDLMSLPPHCVPDTVSLGKARDLMKQYLFRHLPVVSLDQKLIGMLSDRDLLRAGETCLEDSVLKHMSTHVLTATPETPIQQIAEAMLANKIHALPIVSAEHNIIGILTSTDILRAIVQNAPLELWA